MVSTKNILLTLLLTTLPFARILAQTWEIPEEKKEVTCSFQFTPETVKAGQAIFEKNCKSCHGYPGQNNFVKLVPPPGDPATDKFQLQTDGALFYKITTGKAPMPEFRNVLSEEERWQVISFFRSFNKNYVQPNPANSVSLSGKRITLAMEYDQNLKKIRVTAIEAGKDNVKSPLKGAGIKLFVKRYFGNMVVDEVRTTNENGQVFFIFPANIPGDKQGKVEIIARIDDPSGNLAEASARGTFLLGIPNDKPSLIETRAMWTTRDKAPYWVVLTYSLSVIGVWLTIFIILFNVLKIRKIK